MPKHLGLVVVLCIMLLLGGVVGWQVYERTRIVEETVESMVAAPVEVAAIESGLMRDERVLSGTLEASARFVVSPKVAGRIERMLVDLGDPIERNQVIAQLEDAEYVQAVAQAQAELAVREAALVEATSRLDLAQRDLERARQLSQRGIASASQLDEVQSAYETARSAVAVAEAEVERARATLELANIRLGYTAVRASWSGGPDRAVVGERFQDAGNTVQPGDPIVSVVALDPLTVAVTVTERDYPYLSLGQPATLTTDAYPGRTFEAEIVRISPVFRESSRQARVELQVENPESLLRPGMFARVAIVIREAQADAIVPLAALTRRDGREVVFVVREDGKTVRRVDVRRGIVENERVQLLGEPISGRVVVLGQQMLEDGSAINIVQGDGTVEGAVAGGETGGDA